MASENAKAVAEEVLETMGKGKKVSVSAIARKHGYSHNTAKNPKQIRNTQSYKKIVDPIIAKMIKERDAALAAMASKRKKATYRDLSSGFDRLTKNIQLLTGGDTEKSKVTFGWEDEENA